MIEFDETKTEERACFTILHPLDETPEEKVDTEHLGPMRMTKTVRVCLYTLRGYLAFMMLLVLYHVLDLAGVFGKV